MAGRQGQSRAQDRLGSVHEGMASAGDGAAASRSPGPERSLRSVLPGAITAVEESCGTRVDAPGITEQEADERDVLAISHLLNWGFENDAQRIEVIVNDTAPVPLDLLGPAMKLSRQTHEGNWPPTTGQIIKAARDICIASDRARYTSPQGHIGSPRWFSDMKKVRFLRPREIEAGPDAPQAITPRRAAP